MDAGSEDRLSLAMTSLATPAQGRLLRLQISLAVTTDDVLLRMSKRLICSVTNSVGPQSR